MKLLKIEIEGINLFEDNRFKIEFLAEKKVFEYEVEENIITRISNTVYDLNTISLLGINASGKTTTLKLVSEMLSIFINNKSLDYNTDLKNYIDDKITCKNYIYHDRTLYKLVSVIKKDVKEEKLYFTQETLYVKKISNHISRKSFFDFDKEKHLEMKREGIDSDFLKDEDSIFSKWLNKELKEESQIAIKNFTTKTNFNVQYSYLKNLPISYINYLDNSIEYFNLVETEKHSTPRFEIKFKDSAESILIEFRELEQYLSSGTIRGISIFVEMLFVLKTGGYLILDEIENHLNKVIVKNIIEIFNSKVNKYGATLLFSTHYPEIIDSIDRSDSIYIFRKTNRIKIDRLSNLLTTKGKDRTDIIKSDVFLSGLFGTAPSYKNFMKMCEDIEEFVKEEKGAE